MKGTRTQPQCGFSYKVLTLLQEVRLCPALWLYPVPLAGHAACRGVHFAMTMLAAQPVYTTGVQTVT